MLTKITTATILISGLLLTGTSQAAEVSVEQFVGSLVSQAYTATKQEISYGVLKAVLTANNAISADSESELYATNVTITDLDSEKSATVVDNNEAE